MSPTINLGEAMRQAKIETVAKNRKARYRRYYYSHPAEVKERKRAYYLKSSEEIREKNRAYYYRKKVERTQLTASDITRAEVGATA